MRSGLLADCQKPRDTKEQIKSKPMETYNYFWALVFGPGLMVSIPRDFQPSDQDMNRPSLGHTKNPKMD